MATTNDRHTLLWSYPASSTSTIPILPKGITRTFVPTPLGRLELLIAQPAPSSTTPESPRKKALLFQHGGFGCATVWIPYMQYFSALGYPCYALSLRGHGQSWKPGYMRMVWGYGKYDFAQDLGAVVGFVSGVESGIRTGESELFREEDLVLLGHSAGGGLVQYFLGKGMGKVGGLVVIAGFPCFGGWGVYWRWFKMDPWFVPRYYIRDFWHSRSPLSSTTLVHNAFFSPSFPREQVRGFEMQMPEYESMLWPLGQMFSFVNVRGVLRNILGWQGEGGSRLLVVAGEWDQLMGVKLMRDMAEVYKKAVQRYLPSLSSKVENKEKGEQEERITFEVVSASGHHLQNDLHWEEGAKKIQDFLEQL